MGTNSQTRVRRDAGRFFSCGYGVFVCLYTASADSPGYSGRSKTEPAIAISTDRSAYRPFASWGGLEIWSLTKRLAGAEA